MRAIPSRRAPGAIPGPARIIGTRSVDSIDEEPVGALAVLAQGLAVIRGHDDQEALARARGAAASRTRPRHASV